MVTELTTLYTQNELLDLISKSTMKVDNPVVTDILSDWAKANERRYNDLVQELNGTSFEQQTTPATMS